jgi:hypothetical protein
MSTLLRIAILAAQMGFAARRKRMMRRLPMIVGGGIFAVLALVTALGWLVAALWLYLFPLLGKPLGALVVAGVLVLLCLLIVLTIALSGRQRRVQEIPGLANMAQSELVAEEMQRFIARNKGTLLAGAGVAGLLLSVFARRRR